MGSEQDQPTISQARIDAMRKAVDRARVTPYPEPGVDHLRPADKGSGGKGRLLVGLGVLGLVGAAAAGTLVLGGGSDPADTTTASAGDVTTTVAVETTATTDAGATTAAAPTDTVAAEPASPTTVPATDATADATAESTTSSTLGDGVDYSYHEALYRDGKLYLLGYVPSQAVSDELSSKAAEVIGADNVVNEYVVDPRAPEITDGQVRVDEPFLFRPGSAALDPEYTPILDLGVAVLALNPQATMVVIGHTDDLGTDAENDALSLARAQAVVDYMVSRGASPAAFQVEGRGEREPVADNATEEGRSLNRRIEVVIVDLLG